jgi:hypothetical protein
MSPTQWPRNLRAASFYSSVASGDARTAKSPRIALTTDGERISRFNPESEWIIRDQPDLRIIDQELQEKVKARQGALQGNRSRGSGPG